MTQIITLSLGKIIPKLKECNLVDVSNDKELKEFIYMIIENSIEDMKKAMQEYGLLQTRQSAPQNKLP